MSLAASPSFSNSGRKTRARGEVTPPPKARRSSPSRAVLAERRRLAQALHDTVCQSLTGIYLMAATLERSIRDRDAAASESVRALKGVVREASKEVQNLMRTLRGTDTAGEPKDSHE